MKKIVIISLTIILNLSLLTGCNKKNNIQPNNNQNNQEVKNPNDNIQKIQTIGPLKVEIEDLKYENGISTLKYLITNESLDVETIPKYKITVTDDEKILYKLTMTHKDNTLEPNDSKLIKKEIKHDLSKATSITFELVEE